MEKQDFQAINAIIDEFQEFMISQLPTLLGKEDKSLIDLIFSGEFRDIRLKELALKHFKNWKEIDKERKISTYEEACFLLRIVRNRKPENLDTSIKKIFKGKPNHFINTCKAHVEDEEISKKIDEYIWSRKDNCCVIL